MYEWIKGELVLRCGIRVTNESKSSPLSLPLGPVYREGGGGGSEVTILPPVDDPSVTDPAYGRVRCRFGCRAGPRKCFHRKTCNEQRTRDMIYPSSGPHDG